MPTDVSELSGASRLWGDGLEGDRFEDLAKTNSWDLVSEDEMVFYFPKLAAHANGCPPRIQQYLLGCIAAMTLRIRLRGEVHGRLHSVTFEQIDAFGREFSSRRFDDRNLRTKGLLESWRRLGSWFSEPRQTDVLSDIDGVSLLDAVLCRLQNGELFAFDCESSAAFVFFSGIHPAYCCSYASNWEYRDVVAGWLGVLDRGRTAIMPMGVAEYLADAIRCDAQGNRQLAEPILSRMLRRTTNPEKLLRAANATLSGRQTSVRLPPADCRRGVSTSAKPVGRLAISEA